MLQAGQVVICTLTREWEMEWRSQIELEIERINVMRCARKSEMIGFACSCRASVRVVWWVLAPSTDGRG